MLLWNLNFIFYREMNKKTRIFLALFLLASFPFTAYFLNGWTPSENFWQREVSAAPAEAPSRKVDSENLFSFLEKESRGKEPARDPFFSPPQASSPEATLPLNLSGIVWDDNNPTAIINDTIVEKGSTLEGKTVVDILKDRVILNDRNGNTELRLSE